MPDENNKKDIKKKRKKARKSRKLKISKLTLVTLIVVVLLFVGWQLLFVPYMVGQITVPPVGQIPQIKRGDVKFVDEQLSKRTLKNVPSLAPPPGEIGKKNPFE